MAISRHTKRPPKKARIRQHINELKHLIRERYPQAEFQEAPVPESSWPGLWVAAPGVDNVEFSALIREPAWDFFVRENMNVHVILLTGKDWAD
jgi:hypothetical protein